MGRAVELLAVVTLAALVLALGGCGGGGGPAGPTEGYAAKPPTTLTNPAIAYTQGDKSLTKAAIYLMTWDRDGRKQTLKVTAPKTSQSDESAAWHPVDGTKLGYLQREHGIWPRRIYTIKTDGTGLRSIYSYTEGDPRPPNGLLCWFPAGGKMLVRTAGAWESEQDLAVVKDLEGQKCADFQHLGLSQWTYSIDGMSLGPDLGDRAGYHGLLAFSGQGVLASPPGAPDGQSDVWFMELTETDGVVECAWSEPVRWDRANQQKMCVWDRTGQRLAFTETDSAGGQQSIAWTQVTWSPGTPAVTCTGETTVTSGSAYDGLTWSPDGVGLAYGGSLVDGRMDIFKVRADGTGTEDLTNSPTTYENTPGWNPRWVDPAPAS